MRTLTLTTSVAACSIVAVDVAHELWLTSKRIASLRKEEAASFTSRFTASVLEADLARLEEAYHSVECFLDYAIDREAEELREAILESQDWDAIMEERNY